MRADEEQLVSSLLDSGDMGGILCALGDADSEQVALVSLTHLRIRPDHPMRLRVEAYQRDRTRKLMRQR